MQCHLVDDNPWGRTETSRCASPLRCNAITGKIEPHSFGSILDACGDGRSTDSPIIPASPLEPGLSRREVSFSTQMVRRAVSFIFNESAFENDPALDNATAGATDGLAPSAAKDAAARSLTKSPQTAIAA